MRWEIRDKEILQNQLFPEGVLYDRKNGTLRPEKINFIFELIAQLVGNFAYKEKGTMFEPSQRSIEYYHFYVGM